MTREQKSNQLLLQYRLASEESPKHRKMARARAAPLNPWDSAPPSELERAGLRTLASIGLGAAAFCVTRAEATNLLNLIERQGRALLAYQCHYPPPYDKD